MPELCSKLAYYTGIILNALACLLCQNYAGIIGAGLVGTFYYFFIAYPQVILDMRVGYTELSPSAMNSMYHTPCYSSQLQKPISASIVDKDPFQLRKWIAIISLIITHSTVFVSNSHVQDLTSRFTYDNTNARFGIVTMFVGLLAPTSIINDLIAGISWRYFVKWLWLSHFSSRFH